MNNKRVCISYFVLSLLMSIVVPATAADQSNSDNWQFSGELFALGAGIDGTAATGDDIDVSLDDVLDSLDFAFMGSLAARKDKWVMFADFIYVDVGDKATIPLAVSMPLEAKLNLDLKQFISTFGAAYQVAETQKSSFSLLAGGRYLSMDVNHKI